MMEAVALVQSTIIHTRHQPVSHRLERKGLSLLIDLDKLDKADASTRLFSIGRFNLLSFNESDHGPNFSASHMVEPLSSYIRRLAAEVIPRKPVAKIELLTFPRILGQVFNPISVYRCFDSGGGLLMAVYEVCNTFGDMHAYVGVDGDLHDVRKILHVSPFFPVEGSYDLRIRQRGSRLNLAIRYKIESKTALTATLHGEIMPLSDVAIVRTLCGMRMWPMRPIFSIHWEAFKLWRKKVPFFRRPKPSNLTWSLARGTERQDD